MNKKIALFIIALITTFQINAQSNLSIDAGFNAGYHNNLFNSPETYIDGNGDLLEKDALYSSDFFGGFDWGIEFETLTRKKHKFSIENAGKFRKYYDLTEANSSSIGLGSKYQYRISNRLSFALEGEVESAIIFFLPFLVNLCIVKQNTKWNAPMHYVFVFRQIHILSYWGI